MDLGRNLAVFQVPMFWVRAFIMEAEACEARMTYQT